MACSECGKQAPLIAQMHLRVIFPQEVPLLLALAGLELAGRYW
jgi:hypothetical protein